MGSHAVTWQTRIKKRLDGLVLQPLAKWYLSKNRTYRYKGLNLSVPTGVFHPGFFFSTSYLASFLEKRELLNKTFLELGAGSGLLSLLAAQKGAYVTALDISSLSVQTVGKNAKANGLSVEVLESDLFAAIPDERQFDYIVINPPYYPKEATHVAELAWYCGSRFEYFERLFAQLPPRLYHATCWMILSEGCDVETISSIATKNGLHLLLVEKKKVWWEWNFIFEISCRRSPLASVSSGGFRPS